MKYTFAQYFCVMKLKDGFITHEIDSEQIMVSVGNTKFNGFVRSNDTAAFIIDCLKNNTTEKEILDKMLEKYDGDPSVMKADIKNVISKLQSINAIDE